MSDQSELQKAMVHIQSWGRQTIAFALSVRAERIGNPIDGSNRVVAAGKETNAIAKDLWEIAIKECDQPVQPSQMTMKFATKIFDWVTQHLKD